MTSFLSYWFWPNPGGWHYSDPRVQMILAACAALVLLSFVVRVWRSRFVKNPATRTLTANWFTVLLTFGLLGGLLVVCRVETIQFLSMRVLWLVLALAFTLFFVLQVIRFRRRHYVVLERRKVIDEREKYLPRSK